MVVAAPSVILSVVFGWNLTLTIIAFGVPTIFYTMKGGVQAVTWADVKQMAVIVGGLVAAAITLIVRGLPDDVSLGGALHAAGAVGKIKALDFTFDEPPRPTHSGLVSLAACSCPCPTSGAIRARCNVTSQPNRSMREARGSLLMSAFWKIPLQVLVLMVGVLMYVFSPVYTGTDAVQIGFILPRYRKASARANKVFNAR